eukprot:gnl/MRDRNA2_/MRDRNA2_55861_c0_seq1.p1 gnl/MRDRNA2_/MRDRNA2_55861_c0~~gnl/MRDRNA2_/MRDRNA2_55861_c0_seq1.p1  ORF type:complete len:1088 (+),score=364.60 gnl/MRDRNA2_/MRDRNA2_55861_c0_seq1:77-3265(+)
MADVKDEDMKVEEEAKAEVKEDVDMKDEAKDEAKEEDGKDEDMKEEEGDAEEDVPKEPEKPKELEEDAPEDKRPKLSGVTVQMNPEDTTVNVMPAKNGKVIMALSEGGFQFLMSGARANVGVKQGRYIFEVRMLETLFCDGPSKGREGKGTSLNRPALKIGFSKAKSSLFVGDDSGDSVGFDIEGYWCAEGKKERLGFKGFNRQRGTVVAVVLNLVKGSPNENTVSLFQDGTRVTNPMPLPEGLKGATLFPALTWKNITLMTNFGPKCIKEYPFTCTMIQDGAKADLEEIKMSPPKDGMYEVLFPVCVPDEGTFDWLDQFLEKNPKYTEMSDRKILQWATKSGLKGGSKGRLSNDKPGYNFGINAMDDQSIRRVFASLTPVLKRDFVVMEVASNLQPTMRAKAIAQFSAPQYKKVALCVMGEPPADYKKVIQKKMLEEKQKKIDTDFRVKKAKEKREKLLELQKKKAEAAKARAQKKAEKAREKAKKLREKKEAAAKKAAEMKEMGVEDADAVVEEEEEPEEKSEEEPEEKEEPVEEPEEDNEEPPKAELTEEEMKLSFRPCDVSDLTPQVLARTFTKFSVPTKEEGFDEIRFAWGKEPQCKEHLAKWVKAQKQEQRVEDLKPSEWFKEQWQVWQKTLQDLRRKHGAFKSTKSKKKWEAVKKVEAEAEEEEEKPDEEEKPEAEEEKEAEEKKDEEMDDEAAGEKKAADEEKKAADKEAAAAKTAEAKAAAAAAADAEAEKMEAEFYAKEPMEVEDVNDIGNEMPLYAKFDYEDWALLAIRIELHLLVHAFKNDVDDPDRLGISEQHLGFYYQKYFSKSFNLKQFGVENLQGLCDLIKDSVTVNEANKVLQAELSMDTPTENFIRLTEDHRRDRERRVDAGDESARVKIQRPAMAQGMGARGPPRGGPGGPRGPVDNRGGPPVRGAPGMAPRPGDRGYAGGARSSYHGAAAPPAPGQYGSGFKRPAPGGYEPPAHRSRGAPGTYGAPPPSYGTYGSRDGGRRDASYGDRDRGERSVGFHGGSGGGKGGGGDRDYGVQSMGFHGGGGASGGGKGGKGGGTYGRR